MFFFNWHVWFHKEPLTSMEHCQCSESADCSNLLQTMKKEFNYSFFEEPKYVILITLLLQKLLIETFSFKSV